MSFFLLQDKDFSYVHILTEVWVCRIFLCIIHVARYWKGTFDCSKWRRRKTQIRFSPVPRWSTTMATRWCFFPRRRNTCSAYWRMCLPPRHWSFMRCIANLPNKGTFVYNVILFYAFMPPPSGILHNILAPPPSRTNISMLSYRLIIDKNTLKLMG